MGNKSILLVDDEINILNALNRGLASENFKCFIATNGNRALEIMEENDIAVVVTDMRMPGMNGLELLKNLKEKYPNTVRIVLSGYAQLSQILTTINQVNVFKFILKPWDMENEFLDIIREAVDYHSFLIEREATRISQEKRYNLYLNIVKSTNENFIKHDRELSNVKLVSQQVAEYMKNYVTIHDNDDVFKINILNQVYNDYLSSIPLKDDSFTAHNLLKSFKSFNLDNDKKKIKYYINCNDNVKINGSLKLTLAIMSAAANLSLHCKDISEVFITFMVEKETFAVEIRNSHNFDYYKDDNKNSFTKVIDEIIPILFNMCDVIGSYIIKQSSIEATSIKLLLKLQM
jgi:two-component system, NtrC family, response regulator HupR/HoxA